MNTQITPQMNAQQILDIVSQELEERYINKLEDKVKNGLPK